ncbi:lasso peptide biosynthesis B2 protein [Streptomyces sp. 7-21]|uniref:lasso peptide biosynthesis B2 protein n=1 Tax=Streptomyces sp. 7-21 TaxID=2802283 RepID=UPI00191DDA51|nr:lasso peptide biosynthesis B2 protein [Streptomyces sp. 7-21]MBL1065741.1 lasso peptide biosynthesis B2 protein [Streptomyces sp. 7-21]
MMTGPTVFTARLPDGAAAVMDIRTGRGRWCHLNPTAAALWLALAAGTPAHQAVDDLTTRCAARGADPANVRTDLAHLVARFQALGWLSTLAAPVSQPPAPTVRPCPGDVRLTPTDRIIAFLALTAALAMLRLVPIRVTIAALRALRNVVPAAPASADVADKQLVAVRHVARHWPIRLACLEESAACFLAARLRRRGVTFVLGARTAPAAAHAWIETEDQVIGQHSSNRAWPYVPALRI